MSFSLGVFVGAFFLIPRDSRLVFGFSGMHLVAIALAFAFAPLGAHFMVTTSEEVTLGALKFRFWAIFAEVCQSWIFLLLLLSIMWGAGRKSLQGGRERVRGEVAGFQNSESGALSQWDFGFSLCAAP